MTIPFSHPRPLFLGLGACLFIAGACGLAQGQQAQAHSAENGLRCTLSIVEAQGQTTIAGQVRADRPVAGAYELTITSRSAGGQANMRQSGTFEAGPQAPAELGRTTLGGARLRHQAELALTVAGQPVRCPSNAAL